MMDEVIARLMVDAMAVQARIEAMKAQNAACSQDRFPYYGEDAFLAKANELEHISEAMRARSAA